MEKKDIMNILMNKNINLDVKYECIEKISWTNNNYKSLFSEVVYEIIQNQPSLMIEEIRTIYKFIDIDQSISPRYGNALLTFAIKSEYWHNGKYFKFAIKSGADINRSNTEKNPAIH